MNSSTACPGPNAKAKARTAKLASGTWAKVSSGSDSVAAEREYTFCLLARNTAREAAVGPPGHVHDISCAACGGSRVGLQVTPTSATLEAS